MPREYSLQIGFIAGLFFMIIQVYFGCIREFYIEQWPVYIEFTVSYHVDSTECRTTMNVLLAQTAAYYVMVMTSQCVITLVTQFLSQHVNSRRVTARPLTLIITLSISPCLCDNLFTRLLMLSLQYNCSTKLYLQELAWHNLSH